MAELNENVRRLLEAPNFAHVATVGSDGRVQVNPVWVDVDGDRVVFNTAIGRAKERNLRRDPRVTLSVLDAQNPYAYLEIRGDAVLDETGADDHIDAMAKKYLGVDSYPYRTAEERRIKVYVTPTRVNTSNV